jgi:hypothetical protein
MFSLFTAFTSFFFGCKTKNYDGYVPADGKVISVGVNRMTKRGVQVVPSLVVYRNPAGQAVTAQATLTQKTYKITDSLTIYYHPTHPDTDVVDDISNK